LAQSNKDYENSTSRLKFSHPTAPASRFATNLDIFLGYLTNTKWGRGYDNICLAAAVGDVRAGIEI
jgi:hypothetical protein